MTTWLLPIFTALLGYGGHWAQTALARRYKRKDADEERIGGLRTKLLELRDLAGDDADREGRNLAAKLRNDAELLGDRKLRRRVTEALAYIQALWIISGGKVTVTDVRKAWSQDALDCCSAAIRGDRLPKHRSEMEFQLFAFQEVAARPQPHAGVDAMVADSPLALTQQKLFRRWQAKQCPWWRRTPRMWARLVRS
ncbi:hypothetical protein OG564_40900 [Streptomyces sp. NBC_01280]|uniref:hypothetical protein n=1 Tax=unclassified Streptomyces TaxID=2593676 RepID=UPI002E31C784|nr:hypothetical protein [Streptomyces sp. NBC_01280]WSE12761.1 hypothetical protein OG518_05250 [Streptomyces sp. NBC_01397]